MAKATSLKIVVNVTERDIKSGIVQNASNCPIALAVKRVFGSKAQKVSVGGIISVTLSRKNDRYFDGWSPVRVGKFINDFDAGRTVKPFSFKLTLKGEPA